MTKNCSSPAQGILLRFLVALSFLCPVDALAQPIRSGVVLVPVDVRVVDKRGNPVTDLTISDFEVYEDGVRQQIAHFLTQSFAPASDDRRATAPRTQDASDAFLDAATPRRTFLLLLGRGRLNYPAKGLDGLIDFVKNRVQPTDYVSVVAYLRASEPSPDHTALVRFLERYRERHEDIEGRIKADFARTMPFGSPPTLSPGTRSAIEEVFAAQGIPAFIELPGASGTAAVRYLDWNYLRWAMEHARGLRGEKHLVVVAERSLGLARLRTESTAHVLVRWASRARVAITSIHTGGLSGHTMIRGRVVTRSSGDPLTRDAPLHDPADHRLLAQLTGGISSYYQYAAQPLDSLERSSRFQYLLGYYSKTNAAPHSGHRVRVVVSRPGVTALYRHAYQLEPSPADDADLRKAAAEARLASELEGLTSRPSFTLSGQYLRRTTTLKVSIPLERSSAPSSPILVKLSFDAARITFTHEDGLHRASLYGTVIVDGPSGETVGEQTRQFDLALTPAQFSRINREWLEFDVSVPMNGIPHEVRAALYDYDSDRVLTGSATLRRP
jgi:VWFA-related protein